MKYLPALLSIFLCTSAQAIEFTQYVNKEGNLVTSNIPQECVVDGVLKCHQYHPVVAPKVAGKSEADTAEAKAISDKKRRIEKARNYDAEFEKSALGTVKKLQALNKIVKQ